MTNYKRIFIIKKYNGEKLITTEKVFPRMNLLIKILQNKNKNK